MASSVIRVEATTYDKLRTWADEQHRPIGQVVTDLVAQAEEDHFWTSMEEGFSRLRANEDAWLEYQAEVLMLEGGSMDGLSDEEPYYTPEEEAEIEAYAKSQGW